LVEALSTFEIGHVALGSYFSFAVSRDRSTVWSWGSGEYGKLGLPTSTNMLVPTVVPELSNGSISVSKISLGEYHTLILSTDGKVYSCGRGSYGQLGLNHMHDESTVQHVVLDEVTIVDISAGCQHSIVVASNGQVYSFGYNDYGMQNAESTRFDRGDVDCMCDVDWIRYDTI
jgi:alpha-tubulin suppressor-like RCC1 family protein